MIQNDLSPSSLVEAIEESQRLYFRKLMEDALPQAFQEENHRGVSLSWFITGVNFPLLNGVLRAQISKDGIDETVERILEPFKFARVPMYWWIGPSTDPPGLSQTLSTHGLKRSGQEYGMAVDLSKLPDVDDEQKEQGEEQKRPQGAGEEELQQQQHNKRPQGLKIKRVETTYEMISWVDMAGPALGLSTDSIGEALKLFDQKSSYEGKDIAYYLGLLEGKVAATSCLFYGGGVAGLYMLATAPEARGRGVGRTMSLVPLLDARDEGYTAGVLLSTKAAHGLFLSLGFKEYCRFDVMYANFAK